MDIQLRAVTAALAGVLALGFSSSVAAQDQVVDHTAYVNDQGDVVHCVSTENGRTYCGHPHTRYIITGSAAYGCVQGQTWGVDDRGVWVSGGCVADFNAMPDHTVERHDYVDNEGTIVHCVSTSSGRTYCGKPNLHYVIVDGPNQSATACIAGKTWGDDDRGLWVSGGCAANFDRSDASQATRRTTFQDDSGRTVHCVSTAGGRTYCGDPREHYDIAGSVSPVCVEGQTWGYDERGAWVSGGCVADFRVDADATYVRAAYAEPVDERVHCVSVDSRRSYCGEPHRHYAIYASSSSACMEGNTWGVDDGGVWVSGGCAADFRMFDN